MSRISIPATLIALMCASTAAWASGETMTVTTLHDVSDFGGAQRVGDLPGPDGKVSFREAVTAANNEPGPQTIDFAIPPSEYWLVDIALLELENGAFFLRDDDTTVDFRTQTSFAGDTNPSGWEVGIYGLEPNGWGIAAIFVTGDRCTLIGLDDVMLRGSAVEIQGNDNRVLSFTTNGPLGAAIQVDGVFGGAFATGNVIGGTGPGEGNVVSGGGWGIVIGGNADDNVVIGNACIGSPSGGIKVAAATRYGVSAHRNRIGGPTPAERNWVAANGKFGEEGFPLGVQIGVEDADQTIVEGNYIGTTQDGMADHPVQVGPMGISVNGSRGTIVRRNLVSGMLHVGTNHYQGQRFGTAISVSGTCEDTLVVGNLVGTDALGQQAIPNVAGIVVSPFTAFDLPLRTTIGGVGAGEANTIAFSERAGVRVDSLVSSVAIRGNRIYQNGELGIDLFATSGAGVTLNDQDDADSEGGNHLQNYPTVAGALRVGQAIYLVGMLNSNPSQSFALDFFASPSPDRSGFGEGAFYLGSTDVTTTSGGDAAFGVVLFKPVPVGWFITATATNSSLGETSEFSQVIRVTNAMRQPPWVPRHF